MAPFATSLKHSVGVSHPLELEIQPNKLHVCNDDQSLHRPTLGEETDGT
jgi:hypothetical protein